jgi:hypothetical protein
MAISDWSRPRLIPNLTDMKILAAASRARASLRSGVSMLQRRLGVLANWDQVSVGWRVARCASQPITTACVGRDGGHSESVEHRHSAVYDPLAGGEPGGGRSAASSSACCSSILSILKERGSEWSHFTLRDFG